MRVPQLNSTPGLFGAVSIDQLKESMCVLSNGCLFGLLKNFCKSEFSYLFGVTL
jgi:hypothetical protein